MPRAQRRYSDEERAVAVAALSQEGGNVTRTARITGIAATTIRNWARGIGEPSPELVAKKTADLAAMMLGIVERSAGISEKALKAIDAEKMTVELALAVLPIVTRSGGVAFDKYQLSTGGVTARIEHEVIIDAGDDGRA